MLNALAQNPVFRKVRDFFILDPDPDSEMNEAVEREVEQEDRRKPEKDRKVIAMPNVGLRLSVCISDPQMTSDARKAADELKHEKIVIANISKMEGQMQKEYLHFLSGAAYALNGNYKKVGAGVFLFSPAGVPINELEDVLGCESGHSGGLIIEEF